MARPRTRVTLDGLARLSLKGARLQPWTTRQVTWRIGELEVFGILYLGGQNGLLSITFEGQDQKIALRAVPRPSGGVQWYFICPLTRAQVSVLWRSSDVGFISRYALS